MPAPVIVMKDVGGFVADYQTQTAIYRATGREVRLHECRSACTLALSLPNACVYPDSKLKFHLAYDPRNRQVNSEVSQQLFSSYPASVQARLGTLTREYKVLRGAELIALGIRDCNGPRPSEPRIMVASAPSKASAPAAATGVQKPFLAGVFDGMLSVFGMSEVTPSAPARQLPAAHPVPGTALALRSLEEIPLPPARPAEFTGTGNAGVAISPIPAASDAAAGTPSGSALVEPLRAAGTPLPPPRPGEAAPDGGKLAKPREPSRPRLPAIITGAQPILPPGFRAYAELGR